MSGQIALAPGVGELIGDSIPRQARQALENLGEILGAAGFALTDVVSVGVPHGRGDEPAIHEREAQ